MVARAISGRPDSMPLPGTGHLLLQAFAELPELDVRRAEADQKNDEFANDESSNSCSTVILVRHSFIRHSSFVHYFHMLLGSRHLI
jgi:hypothetical protein